MRTSRLALAAVSLAALAVARPAAARTSLGFGGDYLLDPEIGELQVTLAVETPIARHATAGVRFGGMILPHPDDAGVPLDGRLRIRGSSIYAEGLLGAWILFGGDDTLRLHAAFGFGLLTRVLSLGVEVGWLDPTSMIGVRVAFPLG